MTKLTRPPAADTAALPTSPDRSWVGHARLQDALLATALLAWIAATAWMRPLMLPDEGRYVGVAWEMLRSGDWLTPTLNGLPFFHKPPLFYWITAAALGVFGPHEWPARLAPMLGAWLAGWSLFLFLRRWSGAPAAQRTLAVLAVQPLFLVGGQFANLDMGVAGCITATVLCGAHALMCLHHGRPWKAALRGAYALAACGVLAKGLIGAVLPALVLLGWVAAMGWWRLLPRLASVGGAALFVAIAGPWFVAMHARHPGFLHYFFVVQHFQRYAGGGFNNVQPFWFYPAVLALASLPWLPALGRALLRLQRAPGGAERDPVPVLMATWVVVIVGFFSLPASKLVGYVLPAVPPLIALAAAGLPGDPAARRRQAAAMAVSMLAALGLVVGLALHPPHDDRPLARALAGRWQPGDVVATLAPYPYDLAFLARLDPPVVVVRDWDATPARDDWRKELRDAGAFDPDRARRTLLDMQQLQPLLCGQAVTWIVAEGGEAGAKPPAAGAELVHADADHRLWRVRREALTPACPR